MFEMHFPGTDITASRLGMGAMRLPLAAPEKYGEIDEKRAIYMIRHGIDQGITYVDTAYPYHEGHSEALVGRALKDGYRQRVTLATKLPVWKIKTRREMDEVLDEQLRRLGVETIDFYLLHALDHQRFELMKQLDYQRFFEDKIREGKIRYPGFSFHDKAEVFLDILRDYDWKMAQVQMNILDTENQAALSGIRAAGEKGVGIVVMEPLRGGALARATGEVQALYEAFPVKRSAVEWAFRFLMDMPQIVTILSGMSDEAQLEDNLRIFQDSRPGLLTGEEKTLLEKVRQAYSARIKTGCTGCAYCQPCPRGVTIPKIFQGYDEARMLDSGDFAAQYAKLEAEETGASRCVACGQCEKACPQRLPVIRYLKEIRQEAENNHA